MFRVIYKVSVVTVVLEKNTFKFVFVTEAVRCVTNYNRGHIVLEISPAPPFNVGCTNAIDGREFLLQH